jgi:hypothetical protein
VLLFVTQRLLFRPLPLSVSCSLLEVEEVEQEEEEEETFEVLRVLSVVK